MQLKMHVQFLSFIFLIKKIENSIFINRVMIHQPASSYYDGQAGECIMEAEEVLKLRDCITKVYVQRTGKPLWVISEDMERDVFMSAKEAKLYGIVDLVAIENNSIKN
ncbi:hypothetical protein Mapa_018456 [Marchantia paleacea]|nr:hypothetical protein Mapa_018456 [Marchantia paleacea]